MIAAGQPAPEFTLPDQDGNQVSLSDFRGRTVVLAFYPADFSPVCTDQLSLYQEQLGELERQGVELLGISVDSAWTHKAFQGKLDLTIPLLADFHPKGEVAKAYGVYAADFGVAARALVMIGPAGEVLWSHRSASPLEVPPAELIFDNLPASGRGAA
jgi:peroxiredoxin